MKGIVVDVNGDLTSVSAFTILVEGDTVTLEPSAVGVYDFPLTHLQEHLRTGEPVLVGWKDVDGRKLAITLSDG